MERLTPEHRLVILEDTAEIQCSSENRVLLRTSDTVSMNMLLKATMRLRPDRIIVGEVRDGAALTLLKSCRPRLQPTSSTICCPGPTSTPSLLNGMGAWSAAISCGRGIRLQGWADHGGSQRAE
jgi:hypothetical protein